MSTPENKTQRQFSITEDQPTDWFEPLYSNATKDGAGVPWANMATHPAFAKWLTEFPLDGTNETALVVGCGMGDDAIELEALGFQVTAFDVSKTAIDFCNERFPNSKTDFIAADLLQDQPQWQDKFDFVLEIYTVQALPPKFEGQLIKAISNFVAPGGQLLVVAETSAGPRDFENGPPWLLTRDHIEKFESNGLDATATTADVRSSEFGEALFVTTFHRPE